MNPDGIIDVSLREVGIAAYGLVGEAALLEACRGMPASLLDRLGVGDSCGAIVAALPYGEGAHGATAVEAHSATAAEAQGASATTAPPGALVRIARFARANWYAELGARLRDAAKRIGRRLRDEGPAREWRHFVNSAFPEKRLALVAGLGELGLHGLVMLPTCGSAAVLGLLLVPKRAAVLLAAGHAPSPPVSSGRPQTVGLSAPRSVHCKDCGACVAACPTGALGSDGSFTRELCLQHWSSIAGNLPGPIEAAWGDGLYGCDICQEACPRFRPDDSARTARGVLGPGLPAAWLISCPEKEIRAALKKTALGMSWISIEALKRNAGLALRHSSGVRHSNGVHDGSRGI